MLSVGLKEKATGTPPKDGDVELVGDYRGIALGCSVVKVFVGVFSEGIILTGAQGVFRSGRRCSYQCLVLNGVCEVWKRENKNSYS